MKQLYILLWLLAHHISAQVRHTQWTLETKKISDCEYDLVFKVKMDKGYHIYSIIKSEDKGEGAPNATKIEIEKNPSIQLAGGMKETKPKSAFDNEFKTTVRTHENTVVFTQRIKLLKPGPLKITGRYEVEECNENGCTFPPPKNFEINVKDGKVCK